MNDSNQPKTQTAFLSAIVESAVDAIININSCGIIDSVNPAAEQMFGFSADEMVGQNIKMLMPEPYRGDHDGHLGNYLDGAPRKIVGIGREVVGQRKDGSVFPMHLAVSEIEIDDKKFFTGIVRDISNLKLEQHELAIANEELEDRIKQRTAELQDTQADLVRAEKFATLGKVSGEISHKIRNSLNAIKTSIYYLLNAKNPSGEKAREHLERIDRQVCMIDEVVAALSDVAMLPDANLKSTELERVLRAAVGVTDLPPEIDIVFDLPDDLPEVMVDESLIAIVLKNLILNARDAMPDGGKLSIGATANDSIVLFHVGDSGIGISEENLQFILDPLFTTKAHGMGLGLAICREVVEKNNGTLTVESEVGKGSRFTIALDRSVSSK